MQRWISRLDLDAGAYALIPFTSSCHLKPREDPIDEAAQLIAKMEGGKVSLTERCGEVLKEVFHRIDLDGNGYISRMEFDFFQEMTSAESCDDDAWKVIQGGNWCCKNFILVCVCVCVWRLAGMQPTSCWLGFNHYPCTSGVQDTEATNLKP